MYNHAEVLCLCISSVILYNQNKQIEREPVTSKRKVSGLFLGQTNSQALSRKFQKNALLYFHKA